MKINPALSGAANVLALITDANRRFRFDESMVKVTGVLGRTPDIIPYNTFATVEGRVADNFINPVEVHYNRRSMFEGNPNAQVLFQVDGSSTFDDIKTLICTQLFVVKSEVELVDFRTAADSTVSVVTLRPIANSMLYYPEQKDLSLVWNGVDILDLVALFHVGDELHKLMNITLPAPGYF